ncbi:MAG: dihydroorotase [Planctomycetes bacterium]|nr:dihydroorotase [Planctomycetota bacterium]
MTQLFVHGGSLVHEDGVRDEDLLIENGVIIGVGETSKLAADAQRIDATGLLVFPGLIDSQVHFREPGLEHKEDLATGSLCCVAGGVTAFCEMPNTKPPTTDPKALADKLERAAGRSWADYAFFLGASKDNADSLGEWETAPGCAGVKIFMGSSTGSLLVPDDETLERILRSGERRVAVHSEDELLLQQNYAAAPKGAPYAIHPQVRSIETAVRSTTRLLDLVEKTGRKVHLLHISTAEELDLLRERDLGDLVTKEATPNHLFLCAPECYERFGAHAQMNPPVRDRRHRDALREALADGTIDVIGSDHAPHTLEEKAKPWPESPSGIPGTQTILPLLLTAVHDGWLRLEDIVRLLGGGPSRVYGIEGKGRLAPGFDGDFVLVDPRIEDSLPLAWLRSRAGWSPYEGTKLHGMPTRTFVRGIETYGKHVTHGAPMGRPLRYRTTSA